MNLLLKLILAISWALINFAIAEVPNDTHCEGKAIPELSLTSVMQANCENCKCYNEAFGELRESLKEDRKKQVNKQVGGLVLSSMHFLVSQIALTDKLFTAKNLWPKDSASKSVLFDSCRLSRIKEEFNCGRGDLNEKIHALTEGKIGDFNSLVNFVSNNYKSYNPMTRDSFNPYSLIDKQKPSVDPNSQNNCLEDSQMKEITMMSNISRVVPVLDSIKERGISIQSLKDKANERGLTLVEVLREEMKGDLSDLKDALSEFPILMKFVNNDKLIEKFFETAHSMPSGEGKKEFLIQSFFNNGLSSELARSTADQCNSLVKQVGELLCSDTDPVITDAEFLRNFQHYNPDDHPNGMFDSEMASITDDSENNNALEDHLFYCSNFGNCEENCEIKRTKTDELIANLKANTSKDYLQDFKSTIDKELGLLDVPKMLICRALNCEDPTSNNCNQRSKRSPAEIQEIINTTNNDELKTNLIAYLSVLKVDEDYSREINAEITLNNNEDNPDGANNSQSTDENNPNDSFQILSPFAQNFLADATIETEAEERTLINTNGQSESDKAASKAMSETLSRSEIKRIDEKFAKPSNENSIVENEYNPQNIFQYAPTANDDKENFDTSSSSTTGLVRDQREQNRNVKTESNNSNIVDRALSTANRALNGWRDALNNNQPSRAPAATYNSGDVINNYYNEDSPTTSIPVDSFYVKVDDEDEVIGATDSEEEGPSRGIASIDDGVDSVNPNLSTSAASLDQITAQMLEEIGIDADKEFVIAVRIDGELIYVLVEPFDYRGRKILRPVLNDKIEPIFSKLLKSPIFKDYRDFKVHRELERKRFHDALERGYGRADRFERSRS